MFKTIVVGTDGSENAQHAVEVAADLAKQVGGRVVLVHIPEPFPTPIGAAAGYIPYVPQSVIDDSRKLTETAVAGEYSQPLRAAGVPYETRIVEGLAGRVLREAASDVGADLIVVGTRGLNSFSELVVGSTSHDLTRHAAVPVLVVPPRPKTKTATPAQEQHPAAV